MEAERAWEIARAAISSGLYKTVILDELNPTVDLELLPEEPIVQTLLRKPTETEVIITGRCKNQPAYFDLASIHLRWSPSTTPSRVWTSSGVWIIESIDQYRGTV